jgi:hypothetical protein
MRVDTTLSAPSEAGAFQPVNVRRGQGSSEPPASECCVVAGDDGCEAYIAIMRSGILSREKSNDAEAETLEIVEGNIAVHRYARCNVSGSGPTHCGAVRGCAGRGTWTCPICQ